LSGLTADHYTFTGGTITIPIIWGYGSGSTFAQHAGRGATTISLTQDCTNGSTAATINPVVCDMYTSGSGLNYFFTGTYTEIVSNSIGCDSVITINLTVNNNSSSISETSCGAYMAPSGAVFSTSGTYTDTIQNVAGCDSVITIDLVIQNTASSINLLSCEPSVTSQSGNQQWNSAGIYTDTIPNTVGCDSIITVDLSFSSPSSSTITASSCNEYISPSGMVLTSTGTFTDVIPNAVGCDSTITINLTVTDLDNTVTVLHSHPNFPSHIGEILEANQVGATYQWIDCNNNNAPITGATNQLIAPSAPGFYAVVVTNGNCSDTSVCEQVLLLTVPSAAKASISVYPNPSNSIVFFNITGSFATAQVAIYDITGKLLKETVIVDSETAIKLPESLGVYFAKVQIDGEVMKTIKLVKR
ncbi:MAG: T9SS type A sorting domain-containing protein, partial [Putridiphycobacter sp.]|nr:T9SS type A sorting domain-containing protein [Putridiphycobacter sp.]